MIKVLNLYAGIGGNRKYWENVEVTAVEIEPKIAAIYQDFFPDDKMVITDAHQYLLEHYNEFDFIWSSPPCPTHSRFNKLLVKGIKSINPRYADMKLYEEIILLRSFANCKWVVENVKSYYEPLILPQETERHYFWANFFIPNINGSKLVRNNKGYVLDKKMKDRNIHIENWHGYNGDKRTLINNMIEYELGLHILNCAFPENHKHIENYYKQEILL